MWLCIALGLIALVYYVVKSLNYDHWEKKGVATASGNEWFFGHFKPIILVKKHLIELYEAMYKFLRMSRTNYFISLGWITRIPTARLMCILGSSGNLADNQEYNMAAVFCKEVHPQLGYYKFQRYDILLGWATSLKKEKEFPDAPLIGYYVMNVPALLVKDLDIIKTILISEFSSFNFNGFGVDKKADPVAAVHPFVLTGEEWKSARSQVTPSLSLSKLKGYLHGMFKVGDEMVKHVKKSARTGELDAREIAMMYSTDVIGNAIYGIENNTFENKDSLVAILTRELAFKGSVSENIKLFFQRLPIISMFFPSRFVSQRLQNVMVEMTRKIIRERLATGEKRNDLIQLLLSQKENDTRGVFTDEYISGQIFILIIDLYEAGSDALSMILYLISRHPEVQERLRSEIRDIKSKNNGELSIEDLEGAKYLEMVYNESFRFFAFFLSRECTSDCFVPMPGSEPFKITKGTPIIIPVGCILKDPEYYPDPEKFDPERFTEEEVAKRTRFSYMPFGDGPKKCIGSRLVTMHIKAAIVKILDNFKLTPSPKTKYPFEIDPRYTLAFRPKGSTWVVFEPVYKS